MPPHRSKQDTKSDQFKFVDLVSVSACAREAPKKKPLGADAGRMEADGLCVHMTVSKRYQSREGAADTKGGGVDLRFSSAALAKAWVETVNRLRADAATIFTGGGSRTIDFLFFMHCGSLIFYYSSRRQEARTRGYV